MKISLEPQNLEPDSKQHQAETRGHKLECMPILLPHGAEHGCLKSMNQRQYVNILYIMEKLISGPDDALSQ